MNKNLPEIRVSGDGRARGLAHGEAFRDLIREYEARWQDALFKDMGLEPDAYVARMLAETDFMPAIERWTPDLLAEVKGFAEGAGVSFEKTLVRQLSDEEPWFRRELKRSSRADLGCTSAGLSWLPDRDTVIAQNMDTPKWYDGLQVVVGNHDPRTGIETLVFTLPGKLSLAGMNSAGLAICCNTLAQLNYSKTGLPEDFVVRGFLAHRTLEEGLSFMRNIQHASGQNYTVAAPGSRAINLEASAGKVTEFLPFPGADRVFHTNHPLTNDNQSMYRAVMGASGDEEKDRRSFCGTSYERFEVLERLLGDPDMRLEKEHLLAVLSSHEGPICRHGTPMAGRTDNYTLGCLFMELGDNLQFRVAGGPPDTHDFHSFGFKAC